MAENDPPEAAGPSEADAESLGATTPDTASEPQEGGDQGALNFDDQAAASDPTVLVMVAETEPQPGRGRGRPRKSEDGERDYAERDRLETTVRRDRALSFLVEYLFSRPGARV